MSHHHHHPRQQLAVVSSFLELPDEIHGLNEIVVGDISFVILASIAEHQTYQPTKSSTAARNGVIQLTPHLSVLHHLHLA
jgi:hypothetical protein